MSNVANYSMTENALFTYHETKSAKNHSSRIHCSGEILALLLPCKFTYISPVALVAFYFLELIPPSDYGSSRLRSIGGEGKYLSTVQETQEKLFQRPSCMCIQGKCEINRPILVTLVCLFNFHKLATRHFINCLYHHRSIQKHI